MIHGLTSIQLAEALGVSDRRIKQRANEEGWLSVTQTVRGGKQYLFPVKALPREVREAVLEWLAQASPANPPQAANTNALGPVALPAPTTHLAAWQRRCLEARALILAEVERLAAHGGTEAAIRKVIDLAAAGRLPPEIQAAVPVANARAGKDGKRTLSRRSLYRWRDEAKSGAAALAPAPASKEEPLPAWLPVFLKHHRRPSKPSIAAALDDALAELPEGTKRPSYDQVRRILAKIDAVERQRGRLGPNALRSVKSYVKRTTDHMLPGDVFIGDGHCFDAEVCHPKHGGAFRPEVTSILDVATRRWVGYSVDLAESTWAVADALRMAAVEACPPAIYYADRGSGQDNATFNDPVTGILARIGTRRERSIARNSQARGVIEAFNKFLIRDARRFMTYIGADMDKDAKDRVHKITRQQLRAIGTSPLLMPWADFVARMRALQAAYNDRPHPHLPKVRDASTGRLRHQTPNEAWTAALEKGWEPVTLAPAEAEDLFRPYELRQVTRATVKLFGNTYWSRALEPFHGDQVMVGYDINDPGRVWVRDVAERLICTAELDGHARPYFPAATIAEARSVRDQKAEQRAKGRLGRLDRQRAEVLAELHGGTPLLEHAPAQVLPAELMARHAEVEAILAQPAAVPTDAPAEVVPLFPAAPAPAPALQGEDAWYARARALEQAQAAGEPMDEDDLDWLAFARTAPWYVARRQTEDFRAQFDARVTNQGTA